MGKPNFLAERFETHRPHLRAVAYRRLRQESDNAWWERSHPGSVAALTAA
jgi:hypothetical protein